MHQLRFGNDTFEEFGILLHSQKSDVFSGVRGRQERVVTYLPYEGTEEK